MMQTATCLKYATVLVISCIVLGIWFIWNSAPAHALSCIQPGTAAEELDAADVVLYGEVTEVLQDKDRQANSNVHLLPTAATATIEVKEYFKGDLGDEIEVSLGAYAYWFSVPQVGQKVVLYLNVPTAGETISMPLCGRSVVGDVTKELRLLKEAVGQPNPTKPISPRDCHRYKANSRAQQGFGLAHNPRTKALMLRAACGTDGVEVSSQPGSTGVTYKYGYYYHDKAWKRFAYQGAARSSNWLEGKVSYRLANRIATPGTTVYFIAFTCDWDGTKWNCGCTDTACTKPSWQIQQIEVPAQNTGQTFCTQDAMMCPDGTYVGRTGPNCEFVCP